MEADTRIQAGGAVRRTAARWSLYWLAARGHVVVWPPPPRATLADFLRLQAMRQTPGFRPEGL